MIERMRMLSVSPIILIAIVVVGVFLRTYNFSEWLTFNSDQARDALVVRDMVEKNDMPSLGPIAGGTQFRLGPAFYYFQYIGAKIFGAMPNRMAYADLLFGILAIPLMYLLARQYFKKNISLVLMAIYAVAFFTVQYSRFAWNPNSAQFFSMLFAYSILRIWHSQSSKRMVWIFLAGISLGISIQLHVLLLFGLSFVALILAVYLYKNKRIDLFGIAVIIFIVLLLNITQIVNEIRTGSGNYLEFRKALVDKSGHQNPLWKNTLLVVACQAQSNVKILLPYVDNESCDFPLADKYLKRLKNEMDNSPFSWLAYALSVATVIVFSGGGYWLLYRKIRKKKEVKNNNFIILAIINLGLLAIFSPFGAEISLRYFILLIFIPFLLLGLWLEFLLEQNKKVTKFLVACIVFILLGYNLFFCWQTFRAHANNSPGSMIDGTAKQAEEMTNYIIEESGSAKKIQIGGQKTYLGRFYNRISYFAKEKGVEVIPTDNSGNIIDNNLPLFAFINEMSGKCEIGTFYKYGYIEDCKKMYDVTILKINIEK